MAFFALIIGYSGLRYYYDSGLPDGVSSLNFFGICMLAFLSFLTGIGGNGGLVSGMNSTAKSWPDRARATMNGIVISGFGLSAFLFSTIAHIAFPGNTSDFLLVLAIGTSLPMVLGFFLVHPIPLPYSELNHSTSDDGLDDAFDSQASITAAPPPLFQQENNSHTHLLSPSLLAVEDDGELSDGPVDEEVGFRHPAREATASSDYFVRPAGESMALSPTRGGRTRSRSTFSVSRRSLRNAELMSAHLDGPNVHGKGLFTSTDFWVLFTITALLSGTGLMYINNVGSISQALFAAGNPNYDEATAAQWQATQVSIVSVMNCLGRFCIGILADFSKTFLRLPRSFCITLIACVFVVSQVTCFYIDTVQNLWKASALLGLAYGAMFGLFPTIVIEWFGLPHFSENWGFVALAPMLGSNVLSIAFGRNLDAHASPSAPTSNATAHPGLASHAGILARAGLPSERQCFDGRACYVDSIRLTIGACCLALGLALYAGWRDRRRQEKITLKGAEVVPGPEVIWEEEES
ncbi:uncharacterized protein FIBRA_08853 [Fibroporia radiculosa]|uniref:Nodulin-like domain-containing protein n=1 Tax=Fibroporia radiculosa TaxID=599839 RepID=J4GXI3_9APHY|nr:uncharacterized protein FIBRA_08853 [Fibroporia radiculosa]CCM06575.1 predicted protein [Fibroporia radiculosa]